MLLPNRISNQFRTSARGLEAQRIALGAATENLANAGTSRTADGESYALKRAVHEAPDALNTRFQSLLARRQEEVRATDPQHVTGRSLARRFQDQEDMGPRTEVAEEVKERLEYDPTHPHADAQGYVRYADINVAEEMARMISANRIYEANLTAVESTKEMLRRTLQM